jgi:hypothetical protein
MPSVRVARSKLTIFNFDLSPLAHHQARRQLEEFDIEGEGLGAAGCFWLFGRLRACVRGPPTVHN